MSVLHRFATLWRNIVYRDRVDDDLDEEIRAAFESLVDERVRAGVRPEDARREATLEFGAVEGVKERVRDARTGAWFDMLRQDVRYAVRLLRRNRVFTLVATLSLAIGIGANTTIFTVANALLFRAPPGVGEPDRLLDIFRAEEGKSLANFTTSYPNYLDIRRQTTTLETMFAYEFEPRAVSVGAADGTELAFADLVTANYFATLGVAPAAGRFFVPGDDAAPGAAPFVVLSYRFWQRRFNQRAAIVGETVQINRHPFTVIGIARDGFRGTNVVAADLWAPMGMVDVLQPGTRRLTSRTVLDIGMGGRLKPSVSPSQAAAELDAIALGIERAHPIEERGMRLRVARLSSIPGALTAVAAGLLGLLLALVTTVLIIACANVSGVLLARAAARRREIAVRIAIGAGRARLIRQLLTETTLLFALGGAAGLLLARGLTSLLLTILPAFPVPIAISLPLDERVIMSTVGVSLIAALLSGVAPALQASKADVVVALKDESQGPSDRLRVRSAFVIAQVAFSLMLVVIAGLLVQSLQRIGSFDQGFEPKGVEVASLDLTAAGYSPAAGAIFARDLVDRLRALPGIETATLSHWMPGRGGRDVSVTVAGVAPPAGRASFTGTWNAVESDFFRTLRVPLIAGRDFSRADRVDGQPVTIVSETTARSLWPGQSAVGKYITWHEARPERAETVTTMQVIGVVRDLKSPFEAAPRGTVGGSQARRGGQPLVLNQMLMMYVPLQQRYAGSLSMFVRTVGDRRMAPEVRNLVKAMETNLPMAPPQQLDAQTSPLYLQVRVAASVAGAVGVVGLLLAAIGVYGVTAYATVCRTREIGVRMALGARRGAVIAMVLRQGMSLVGIGAFVGLILAAAGSRLFGGLLAGVPPADPMTFAGATMLFALVGLAACYVPARRATQIDAIEALRYE